MTTGLDVVRTEFAEPECLPRHVAIIMDGNARWADQRELPILEGHRRGAQTLKQTVKDAVSLGLAELTVYAFSTGLTDSGMFIIHAAGAPEKADELFAVIRDELQRAAERGFDQVEIDRVKAQLKMGLLAGLESSSGRAEQLARHVLFHGRLLPPHELIERIERVELADLQVMVEKILASPLSLATVGPILNVARFEAVAGKFAVPASKAA